MPVSNPNPNFLLNASSSSLSLVAGANITLNTGASSITIVGNSGTPGTNTISASGTSIAGSALSLALVAGANISLQTTTGVGSMTVGISGIAQTQALTALGNTTVSSAGTLSNPFNISGAGIASVGVGNGTLTISVPAAAASGILYVSATSAAGGATAGTVTSAPINSTLSLIAGANMTLSQGSNDAITFIGPTPSAAAVSISATSAAGGSITGGANAAFTTAQFIAGANVGISQNGQSLTFSAAGATLPNISFIQNVNLQQVGILTSTTGTVTGTAGFGSSLFLQRLCLPLGMKITEADLAMGISFPVTSQGGGTLSRSLVIYSFGNSTSLASVASISGSSSWVTGTSTAGGATSLTAYQGGWAGSLIWPMTFASTSLGASEYVIGNLINFAQASSTWSVSMFGANVGAASQQAVLTSAATLAVTDVEATKTFASSAASSTANWVAMNAIARTNVSATSSATVTYVGATTLPSFGFIGTGATTSNFAYYFNAGIMSTGAIPVAITLTSTAVTYTGSTALIQPWFALAGA